jgi:methyl-accepting chemotaxis protein
VRVAGAVEEQQASTKEIAQNIAYVVDVADETRVATGGMADAADELRTLASERTSVVDAFRLR